MFGSFNAKRNIDENVNGVPLNAGNPDLDDLREKVDDLNTLVHAFWILFQESGIPNDKLDEAITKALDIDSQGAFSLKGMVCPHCGMKAQYANTFKIKCIYCGSEAIINPYEAREIAAAYDEEMERQEAEEQAEKQIEAAQPYDVNKDLNFDDYDHL